MDLTGDIMKGVRGLSSGAASKMCAREEVVEFGELHEFGCYACREDLGDRTEESDGAVGIG